MLKPNYTSLAVSDGTTMDAYTLFPDQGSGPFPGLMLFQEAFGVNNHLRNIAGRLTALGYAVVAPELFHRTGPGFEGDYNNFPGVMPHIKALTIEGLEADVHAAFGWLQQQDNVVKDKIGSIGFCMGGRISFLANMILPLSAAVSYYAGNIASITDRVPQMHAPQLMFWGGLDKHIPEESILAVIKALKDAGKEYTNIVISNADHGFNCDERAVYNPNAAADSWAMTTAFLKNRLQ